MQLTAIRWRIARYRRLHQTGPSLTRVTVPDEARARWQVLVDQVQAGQKLSLSSSVSVFDGSNGDEIWSRPQSMALTVAYPVKDSDGDDAPDIVVHTFHIDGMNGSLSTRIARVSGASGMPLLAGCIATFECFNRSHYAEGDHLIFVGEVEHCSHHSGGNSGYSNRCSSRCGIYSTSANHRHHRGNYRGSNRYYCHREELGCHYRLV